MRHLTKEEYNEVINKQLEHHGVKIEDIGHEEGWYNKYTQTEAQHAEWKAWTITYIRKKCRVSKAWDERTFPWLDLMHGLKIKG